MCMSKCMCSSKKWWFLASQHDLASPSTSAAVMVIDQSWAATVNDPRSWVRSGSRATEEWKMDPENGRFFDIVIVLVALPTNQKWVITPAINGIPLSKWVITPAINGIGRVNPRHGTATSPIAWLPRASWPSVRRTNGSWSDRESTYRDWWDDYIHKIPWIYMNMDHLYKGTSTGNQCFLDDSKSKFWNMDEYCPFIDDFP